MILHRLGRGGGAGATDPSGCPSPRQQRQQHSLLRSRTNTSTSTTATTAHTTEVAITRVDAAVDESGGMSSTFTPALNQGSCPVLAMLSVISNLLKSTATC